MTPALARVVGYARSHWKQLLTAAVAGAAIARGLPTDAAIAKANALIVIIGALLGS
jgi:hypothetical protein